MKKSLKNWLLFALFVIISLALPGASEKLPYGNALLLAELPIMLCGFFCGWQYGAILGFANPFLCFVLYGTPGIYPDAVASAFTLATYGFVCGLLYKRLPKKVSFTYFTLVIAMLCGRFIFVVVRYIMLGIFSTSFSLDHFFANQFSSVMPGIALELIIIPLAVNFNYTGSGKKARQ